MSKYYLNGQQDGRTWTDGQRMVDDDSVDDGMDGRTEDDDGDDGTRRDWIHSLCF